MIVCDRFFVAVEWNVLYHERVNVTKVIDVLDRFFGGRSRKNFPLKKGNVERQVCSPNSNNDSLSRVRRVYG